MTYTISKSDKFGWNEITFDCKPSEAVRDALKSLKFRWFSPRKVWYGWASESEIRTAISGVAEIIVKETKKTTAKQTEKANKFGVKVGDIFSTSWGYEQTNNDFFQVIALVGESSVRVREVNLPRISSKAISSMSEDITYQITKDLLPPAPHSVFIKDQEKGDLKRLKSWQKDGSHPQFNLSSFCDAHYVESDKLTVYESWYA